MQNETNIEALRGQLLALGFPHGLEKGLRANICLQQERFSLTYRQVRGRDVLNVYLLFQRKDADYHCLYFDAGLRRQVDIPALTVERVDTAELEARMKCVDWHSVVVSAWSDETLNADNLSWEKEETIEGIVTDLTRLCASGEGAALAALLKRKYWTGTPLEDLLPAAHAQKSSLEVGQRFYFFEGEGGITLEEAYRFLCHRWREKQWHADQKLKGTGEGTSASKAGNSAAPPKRKDEKEGKQKG